MNNITKESLLAIAIGFIATGVGLVQAGKLIEGGIITLVGFALIVARGIMKKYNC
jgi:ABC-type amino acid transport system permease subunit